MQPNYNAAIRFLVAMHPHRKWVLTAIKPDKGGITTATFDEQRCLQAYKWLGDFGEKQYNLYFTVNPPDIEAVTKPSKSDILAAHFLHVDCDTKDGKTAEADRQKYTLALESFKPAPSAITISGNGVHGYWRLSGDCEPSQAEAANKILEEKFTKQKQTWNVDRIMRLPGTVNYPSAAKIKKGMGESLASIVELNLDRQYDITEFPLIANKPKPQPKPQPQPKINDRSTECWALERQMIVAGRTDDEIAKAILDPTYEPGGHFRERPDPDKTVRDDIIRIRGKQAEWPGGINPENENPFPNRANLQAALDKEKITIQYDEFADRTAVVGVRGFPEERRLDDILRNRIKLDIEDDHKLRFEEQRFDQALGDIAVTHKHNPVQTYLDSQVWDGVPRLDTWLQVYGGAPDTDYARAVGRIHLIAGVRRVRQPGCKYDTMLIFISKQGLLKSTAIEKLAKNRAWFAGDLNLTNEPKQLMENISGKWIVECAEMRGNSRAEVSTVKGMLSRTHDIARMAYGRFVSERPRKSIFFGSTNDRKFLYDPTGARRFWPVDVQEFKTDELEKAVDQLWAEAAQAESNGESITLPRSLWEVAGIEQERATLNNTMFDSLEPLLYGVQGIISPEDLWKVLGFADARGRGPVSNLQLAQAMQKLGWERQPVKWSNGKEFTGWVKGEGGHIVFRPRNDGSFEVDETPDRFH